MAQTDRIAGAPATSPRRTRIGYLPGLDGLRGVAVAAVFLHHAEVLDGGFLGVDVFFVISGFLITSLAITEIESTGRLRLGAFWARRARRLLPALFALCAGVVVWSAASGESLDSLPREVLATVAYVANWDRLREGYEYFAAYEQPSLLEHTWSLAIEEQFYVVWPLIVTLVAVAAARSGRSVRGLLGATAIAAAVASAGWSWWLAADGALLNRLYFGTDTRGVGLAIGCAAACLLARGEQTGQRTVGAVGSTIAIGAGAVLAVMMVTVDGRERWLYEWGFPLAAVASIILVVGAIGAGPLATALSMRPLVALGRVSYGVYLWHWPVIVVLDSDRVGLSGLPLGVVWVVVTAIFTVASWYLIELRAPQPSRAVPRRAVAYGAVAVLVVASAATVSALEPDEAPTELVLPTASTTSVAPAATSAPESTADPVSETEPDATTTVAPRPSRPLRMLILGDSIAESLGAPLVTPFELDRLDVEVTNRSVIACPVTFEGDWLFDDGRLIGDPAACDAPDRFAADVAEVDPDLVFFLFGWGGGIAGRQLPDGEVVAPCDAGFDDRYRSAYAELIERVGADAEVVVATVPAANDPASPQADRPGCINAAIASLDVATFDFGAWLCPDDDCTQAAALRRDAVHFASTPEVRSLVWPAIVDEVIAALGTDTAVSLVAEG